MRKVTIFLLSFILYQSVFAQNDKIEKIDSVLSVSYEQGIFNGSVLVSMNGKDIYKKGFGYANFEYKIPNTVNTKFEIGSCTKQFTSMLILMLMEKGKIDLDEKITAYLPEYPSETGNKISIHNLLSHTSGIPDYIGLPELECLLYKENAPDEFIKVFWNLKLDFEPNTKFQYSNSNYFILGVIIERITGKSYSQMLQEYIFTPLEMYNSGTIDITEILEDKAYGYIHINDTLTVAPRWNTTAAYAAGTIYSTIEDLLKWQLALQSNKLISQESFDKMLTPNLVPYGYGFAVLDQTKKYGRTFTLYGHEGEIPGFRSLIHNVKEDNSTIILLDNNQNTSHFKIAEAIRKVLYQDEYE
ncbi:serine hydrolase [Flammeovirga sp. EKP202]|uniref:serine hydrolase domain-containing protein n=1 Tax=Flammeovirga sp. EKP202 TaxID=2770592 RepID=UPI00165FC6B0|nr:serine hydrolase domain-containing protein [Flammeovirga sp. EKP202]MBD0405318.1 beta-lactamase family protein [Flammeovirga sp. EKP202]